MPETIQPSFARGELSPELYARVDTAQYGIGLRTCRNFFVKVQGGAANRPGLQFISHVQDHSVRHRLIPFQFNTEQTYALLFGDQTLRFITNGGLLTESQQTITGATQANPVEVTVTGHGYSVGEEVYIAGVGGMTQLNGRFFTIGSVPTADTFTLQGVDGTGYDAYTSGGTVERVYELATPYAEADVPDLAFTQSADVLTLTHPDYEPRNLSRSGVTSWSLDTITIEPGIDAPTGVSAAATSGSGSTSYTYVVTAVADESDEESLPSSTASTTNDLATEGNFNTVTWTAVSGAKKYNVYKEENGIYGFIGSAGGTSFEDDRIDPDSADTAPQARNPFDGAGNYPSVVTYHEQRRVFAGSTNQPQTVWGSQSGAYANFNVSVPTKADDAWTFTIAARQVNQIRAMVSLRALLVFTSGAEWVFSPGSGGDVITPSSISVEPQSYRGSANVPPIVIGNDVLFVQTGGQTVRNFAYSFDIDGYGGQDVSVNSKHLMARSSIREWAYQQEPNSIVWAVREDGTLLSLTYQREQQVAAWARHDTDGEIESVCAISEGADDRVYVIVKRTIGGQTRRYVERFCNRAFDRIEQAFFVDSGLSLDQWNSDGDSTVTLTGGTDWTVDETLTLTENGTRTPFTSGLVGQTLLLRLLDSQGAVTARARLKVTSYTSATELEVEPLALVPEALRGTATDQYALGVTTLSGLDHLEGKTVSILADGAVEPQKTVSGGSVTIDNPAAVAHVGLPYTADMQTLDIGGGLENPLLAKNKRIGRLNVFVQETRGLFAGPDADHLVEYKQRTDEPMGTPTQLRTGLAEISITPTWQEQGRIFIRQRDPLPIAVNAVIPDVGVSS